MTYGICGRSTLVLGVDGWYTHYAAALCCIECSAAFSMKTDHGPSKRRWTPQTTRNTPKVLHKPNINWTEPFTLYARIASLNRDSNFLSSSYTRGYLSAHFVKLELEACEWLPVRYVIGSVQLYTYCRISDMQRHSPTGIVDKDGDVTKLFPGFLGRSLHVFFIGKIAHVSEYRSSDFANHVGRFFVPCAWAIQAISSNQFYQHKKRTISYRRRKIKSFS